MKDRPVGECLHSKDTILFANNPSTDLTTFHSKLETRLTENRPRLTSAVQNISGCVKSRPRILKSQPQMYVKSSTKTSNLNQCT